MADQISPPPTPEASLGFDASRHLPFSTSFKQAKQPTSNKSQVYPVSGPADGFAQPPPSHNQTHNISLAPLPALPTSPTSPTFAAPKRSITTPVSTGKALRFANITGSKAAGDDKARPADPRRKSGSDVTTAAGGGGAKRRASAEQKNNVHTRSGRHGDEWLFEGWSRLWVNSPKEDAKDSK